MFHTTRMRLTVLNTLIFFLILSLFGAALYFFVKIQLYAKIDASLLEQAKSVQLTQNGPGDKLYYPSPEIIDPRVFFITRDIKGTITSQSIDKTITMSKLEKQATIDLLSHAVDQSPTTVVVDGHHYRVLAVSNKNKAILSGASFAKVRASRVFQSRFAASSITEPLSISSEPATSVINSTYLAAKMKAAVNRAGIAAASGMVMPINTQVSSLIQPSDSSFNTLIVASPVATMQFISNMDPELNMLNSLLIIILAGVAIGGLLTLLAGFFLAQRALIPIRESWEKQQQFVADASHELRTPLSYSYQFKEVKLILQEQGADQSLDPIGEFSFSAELMKLTELKGAEAYEITDSGRKAKLAMNIVSSYSHSDSDLVYTEISMENTEKRFTQLTRLIGYFKTKSEVYYPASLSDIQQRISPNGIVLLSFWSKMPKGFSAQDLQLVIGQAVSGNKVTPIGGIPDGFIKAIAFQLPEENKQVKNHSANIEIGAYDLSLSKIQATLGAALDEIQLSFKYRLDKKQGVYEAYPEGHKLFIEVEAGNGKFSEMLDFESAVSGKTLQLGGANVYQIVKIDSNLITDIGSFDNFTLRLYDEFQGHRKLLAERTLNWFEISD